MKLKNIRFLLVLLVFLIVNQISFAQQKISIQKPLTKIYGINEDKLVRIKPPQSFFDKSTRSIDIVVNYNGFTEESKAAFQYAVDIWASIITSNHTMYIDAYWKDLGEGVLGSAGPTNFFNGINGMIDDKTYYPICLAEKMTDEDLNNPGEPDIIAFFNSSANWYYKTDGNTPSGQYDLSTVVLHELCHGLGFVGSITVEDDLGYWGWGDKNAFIFDKFLFDANGKSILDSDVYPNGSNALKNGLCGSDLFFDAPITTTNYGEKVKLFTPATWSEGSSVYHFNTMFEESANTLMLPFINTQSSIHNPGLIANSILFDMGWNNTRIRHEPLHNRENLDDILIVAKITSDYETEIFSPTLHFTSNGSEEELTMILNNATGNYEATIPISDISTISYYLTAKDKFDRLFRLPASAPSKGYELLAGPDLIPPVITHTPTTFILEDQTYIDLRAQINDLFGVDKVSAEIYLRGELLGEVPMQVYYKDTYNVQLGISSYNLKEGDIISYKIMATDVSKNANTSTYPETGYIEMVVEPVKEYIDTIYNTFETINSDFVLNGFEIGPAQNFSTNILQTPHPYREGGDGAYVTYTASTRYPVLIDPERHFLTYQEVVLVEPGEEGSRYGDEDFTDYVVVEAKKDKADLWVNLINGYDSSDKTDWLNKFNASIVSSSSRSIGSENLFEPRIIDLTANENFNVGDKIYLRFRFYSDAFTNGWGWGIDNVGIQSILNKNKVLANNFKVYPNPVTQNFITITHPLNSTIQLVEIWNHLGQKVKRLNDLGEDKYEISSIKEGRYLLKIQTNKTTHFQTIVVQ